jgi:putative transposase
MKNNRFTTEQIILILKEAEEGNRPIAEVCRSHNISEATFYNWRKKYGGMEVKEARRLKDLEKENAELKRLLAETMLAKQAIENVLKKL